MRATWVDYTAAGCGLFLLAILALALTPAQPRYDAVDVSTGRVLVLRYDITRAECETYRAVGFSCIAHAHPIDMP